MFDVVAFWPKIAGQRHGIFKNFESIQGLICKSVPAEMSKPLNNDSRSGFWSPVLIISVMVRIIITGFEDFSSG